eukprot:TRINITY_DN13395_c1_g1_i1.p2 TRINITY_DN13395_c1_g1~~TRINITY_DN13395_c1_g1_i1.p2  ORF type:complete len:262 (-),score=30.42 TRINITY_DN13395_c1_g1_i1:386-1132(-)
MFKFETVVFPVRQKFASVSFSDTRNFSIEANANKNQTLFARVSTTQDVKPGFVVEPITQTKFPTSLHVQEQEQHLELIGVGVRSKKIMGIKNINVYSVAMYSDKQKIKQQLKSKNEYDDSKQLLFDDVINSKLGRALRMVVVFRMSKQTFWNAMNSKLRKPMSAANEENALAEFRQSVDTSFDKGTVVMFSTSPDGTVVTKINGKTSGSVQSQVLCNSIFDIYLGSDPPSPQAKEQIGKGLMQVLEGK